MKKATKMNEHVGNCTSSSEKHIEQWMQRRDASWTSIFRKL
jgi:hypothetical protein